MKIEFFAYIGDEYSLVGYQRSYKLILLKSIFLLKDPEGYASFPEIIKYFKMFYLNRKNAGLIPDMDVDERIKNIEDSSDLDITRVILTQPYKVIADKGFLSMVRKNDVPFIKLAHQLSEELTPINEQEIIELLDKKIALYYSKIDGILPLNHNDEHGEPELFPTQFETCEENTINPFEKLKKRLEHEIPECILLGDIKIDIQEYELLMELLKNAYRRILHTPSHLISDSLFAIALIQIGVKHYDGNFWKHVNEALELDDPLPGTHQKWIGESFLRTMKSLKFPVIDKEDRIHNILMHSFVSDYYMEQFFEYLYYYYKIDLSRDIARNIDDQLDHLVKVVASEEAAKRMNLVKKHTSMAFFCNRDACKRRVVELLGILDKLVWDIPIADNNMSDRFIVPLEKWIKTHEDLIAENKNAAKNGVYPGLKKRRMETPFIQFDFFKKQFNLVIPPQLVKQYDVVNLQWKIQTTTKTFWIEAKHLEAMTGLKTEEVDFPIGSDVVLEELFINLFDEEKRIKSFTIDAVPVRFFDDDGDMMKLESISIGVAHAFLKQMDKMRSDSTVISSMIMDDLRVLKFEFKKGSIIYLPDDRVLTVGVHLNEGLLDRGLVEGAHTIVENRILPIYSTPPIILVKINKNQLAGTAVRINNQVRRMDDCDPKEITINELNAKYAYILDLERLGVKGNGVYNVTIDVPNKRNMMMEFSFINRFFYHFENSPYIFKEKGTLVFTDGLHIEWEKGNKIEDENKWDFMISDSLDRISVDLISGRQKMNITLYSPVLQWKLDESVWSVVRPDDIWYTDFPNFIYLKFPEEKLKLMFENNINSSVEQSEKFVHNKSEGFFKCDMTKFKSWIGRDKVKRILSIDFTEGHVPFLNVITRSVVHSRKLFGDFDRNILIGEFDIIGRADYYVDIEYQGNTVANKVHIEDGRIECIMDIQSGIYHAVIYENEANNDFGVSEYQQIGEYEKELLNPTKLAGKNLSIKKLKNTMNTKFTVLSIGYSVQNLLYLGRNKYTGKLYVRTAYGSLLPLYDVIVEFIDPENMKNVVIKLLEFDKELSFIYDKENNRLINDAAVEKGLKKSSKYSRYYILDEDSDIFEIEIMDDPINENDEQLINTISEEEPDIDSDSNPDETNIVRDARPLAYSENPMDPTYNEYEEVPHHISTEPLDIFLSQTGLRPMAYNALRTSNLHTIRDLMDFVGSKGIKGLKNIHGLNAELQEEVKDIIRKYKLI